MIAPHRADRRTTVKGLRDRRLDWLAETTAGLDELRAGRLGMFALDATAPDAGDPLFAPARSWISRTPYRPTRHPRRGADPGETVILDCLEELERRGLPRPTITVLDCRTGPRGGVHATLQLDFAKVVRGPLLLGRASHFGAGLFVGK